MLIDTHAHVNMPEFFDLADVLARAKEKNVKYIIDVGFDPESIERSLQLSAKAEEIYSVIGIHPHDAKLFNADLLAYLRKTLGKSKKIVGIGETGLDYFKSYSPKDKQIEAYQAQIKLAKEFKLPLAIHSRASEDDAIKILRQEASDELSGVFHCYAGDVEQAQKVIDLGFYISVTGIVTFPKAKNIVEVVKSIPLDRIMLETDCPYLAPIPYRGKRNEPANISIIADKISEILGISTEEVALKTSENARRLFKLP
ncbi:MAG: TatD family hydrolase [Candidatus Margulisbacteria bacterium]|nr:TatD family hydrolase [Candidatus Margulisiibacteriota bacterium]MBU1022000.1 TatD family hydrolase [Candidatus Margulisiibacteriota bacterium]MBU1729877.1 TatD family hydrolase [Candidatus Margulisiibacteriota bacterium]MBU1955207.1 TatD family hydrolase [Candidatus Margulisiibacteriota bacterium]